MPLDSAEADCRRYEQPAPGLSANPTAAFLEAQARVARWAERHPGLRVRAWRLIAGKLA
jgi:hypothetical protein